MEQKSFLCHQVSGAEWNGAVRKESSKNPLLPGGKESSPTVWKTKQER